MIMDVDLSFTSAPKLYTDARFAGLVCIRTGIISIHVGENDAAQLLCNYTQFSSGDVWSLGNVVPLPKMFVNALSGQFAVMLARPEKAGRTQPPCKDIPVRPLPPLPPLPPVLAD